MKLFSRILTCLLCLVLLLSLSTTVLAAGTVSYDPGARKFFFGPGTEGAPENLFPSFQNVMPGDTLTEQIRIVNDTKNNVKIKIYLRSKGAQEGTDAFLSQMLLTVKQNGDSIMFDAPANETAQLTDWVYLGTVYSGGIIILDLTLTVPKEMGDEFQNMAGYIDWEFKVEEFPVEPTDPSLPQTGDHTNLPLYFGLMVGALAGLIVVFFLIKRKKEQ